MRSYLLVRLEHLEGAGIQGIAVGRVIQGIPVREYQVIQGIAVGRDIPVTQVTLVRVAIRVIRVSAANQATVDTQAQVTQGTLGFVAGAAIRDQAAIQDTQRQVPVLQVIPATQGSLVRVGIQGIPARVDIQATAGQEQAVTPVTAVRLGYQVSADIQVILVLLAQGQVDLVGTQDTVD